MYDVAVIGGGPAGSTCAGILRKYGPKLEVVVLEREEFPRDHVGESLLPPVSHILYELGCWQEIESAGFPIKIGGTYRWGKSRELWDLDFFPPDLFRDEPRPAPFAGQRRWTAFQVDRSLYDKILLDHAKSLGVNVREGRRVARVFAEEGTVGGLELDSGETIEAKFYVDASGHSGVMRRALGIPTELATSLQNVAVWEYWQNAKWAVEIGVGGTRIQVMSLGYGWIWFIPLGPTRTSVGLVVPVSYFKESGRTLQELYDQAIGEDSRIAALMESATREGKSFTTKDWSFIAEKHCGPNWFLAGESAGFADPILSAGVTLTHVSARECAITILELLRGRYDGGWLLEEYESRQRARIGSHIRFADYWYSTNEQLSDLKEFTAKIAADNGLELTPDKAWQWLAQGGFIDNDGNLGAGTFTIDQIKGMGEFMADIKADSVLKTKNTFKLVLEGAEWRPRAHYAAGRIDQTGCYVREGRVLPLVGVFDTLVKILSRVQSTSDIAGELREMVQARHSDQEFINEIVGRVPHALEGMVSDGWIEASYDPGTPLRDLPERVAAVMRWNEG